MTKNKNPARKRDVQAEVQTTQRMSQVGPLIHVPELLAEFACDAAKVIDAAGLTPAQLESPEYKIPYQAGGRLLAECVKATSCDFFGLLLGQKVVPAYLGVVGFLAQSATTVGEALNIIAQYQALNDEGGTVTFFASGKFATIGYVIHEDQLDGIEQVLDMTMAASCGVIRALCGASWNPSEAWLRRRTPSDLAPYRRLFRSPLVFDVSENSLIFESKYLEQPLGTADPGLHEFLSKNAIEHRKAIPHDLLERLHKSLQLRLTRRQGTTIEDLSAELGLHSRTLSRRLNQQGTTFRDERDRVREAYALQLLETTEMPIAEIADALGYMETSSFDHAFTRWKQMNPAQWRRLSLRKKS